MKKKKIYDGTTKKVYETEHEGELILEFKNDIPFIKKEKRVTAPEKGAANNQLSSILFRFLESYHIPTHFIKQLSKKEMLVKKLEMIPLQVVVRNIAVGSLVKRYGIEKGKELECPVIEFYLKSESEEAPLINKDHIVAFGHATSEELREMHRMASKINVVMRDFFRRRRMKLADFRLEFGRLNDRILVGDEISMDTCTLIDLETGEMYEWESMKNNVKKIEETYKKIAQHLLK